MGLGRHLVREEPGKCSAEFAAGDSGGTVEPGRAPECLIQASADTASSEERTGQLGWQPATGPQT